MHATRTSAVYTAHSASTLTIFIFCYIAEVGKENTTEAKPSSARRLADDYLDRNTIELPAEDRSNRPRHRLDEMLAEEGVDAGYHPEGAEEVRRESRRAEEMEYKQRSPPSYGQMQSYEPRSIEKSSKGGRGGGYDRRDEPRDREYEPREDERGSQRRYDDDDRERDRERQRDRDERDSYGRDGRDGRGDRERDTRERDHDRARDTQERQRERDARDRELDAQYARRDREHDGRRDREYSRNAERMPSEMYANEAPVGPSRSDYPDEYSPGRSSRSYQTGSEPRIEEQEPEVRSLEFVQGKAQRQQYNEAEPRQGGGEGGAAARPGGSAAEADEVEKEYPAVTPIINSSAGTATGAAAAAGSDVGTIPDEENPIYFDTADPQALLEFVSSPAPELAGKIKCEIKRDKKGIGKGSYPVYYLRLERPNLKDPTKTDKVFLLAGRKRKKSKTSNYLISVDSMDLSRDSDSFVAKLRSNFVGTSFTIFDNGESLKTKSLAEGKEYRKELGAVLYETNILGYKGPRKMTVIIPAMDQQHQPMEFRPMRDADQLLERVKLDRMDDLVQMTNKSPTWSEDSMSYVLNFNGRVTMASVKNFQIVHAKDPEYVVLQFGRVAEHHFTMDYQYPMSAIQAFAICLSSLDGKLACE